MKVATWNINGIKARIEAVTEWITQSRPDILCLQEIKSIDEGFPREPFETAGYNVATHGQKGFNGVAILSRLPFDSVDPGLPGDPDDEQARFIVANISGSRGMLTVACAYMPNGNPVGTAKLEYKMAWMGRLEKWVTARLKNEVPLALVGDYNIIPDPADAKNPADWIDDALYLDESRASYRRLIAAGLTDAVNASSEGTGRFTFWDFQGGAWQKNNGIRIDHILLSAEAADGLMSAGIDKHVRAWERPSDHVPVWVDLEDVR